MVNGAVPSYTALKPADPMVSSDCRCSHIWLDRLTMMSGTLEPVSLHTNAQRHQEEKHTHTHVSTCRMLLLWFIIFKPWLKNGFINIRRVYTEMPVLLLSHLSKWIERFRLTLTISHFTTVICTDGMNKIFFFCFLLVLWVAWTLVFLSILVDVNADIQIRAEGGAYT